MRLDIAGEKNRLVLAVGFNHPMIASRCQYAASPVTANNRAAINKVRFVGFGTAIFHLTEQVKSMSRFAASTTVIVRCVSICWRKLRGIARPHLIEVNPPGAKSLG